MNFVNFENKHCHCPGITWAHYNLDFVGGGGITPRAVQWFFLGVRLRTPLLTTTEMMKCSPEGAKKGFAKEANQEKNKGQNCKWTKSILNILLSEPCYGDCDGRTDGEPGKTGFPDNLPRKK